MSLRTYKAKRHFEKTSEPSGASSLQRKAKKGKSAGLSFVVQKHDATRLHYDFRLELDGVLLSWAVPKGPSLDPADKRLAVQVEDHPLEYASFEGTIPQGQYGGGTVMVWDRGTWTPKPGQEPRAALKAGKLELELRGQKLQGGWMLVRMSDDPAPGSKPQWLLRKLKDEQARTSEKFDVTLEHPLSVKSGRDMDAISKGRDTWESGRAKTKKAARPETPAGPGTPNSSAPKGPQAPDFSAFPLAVKAPMPRSISPQLATLVDQAPRGDEWIHEVKFDGYRILAFIEKQACRLTSRNDKDWSLRFGPIRDLCAQLPVSSAILDGEVVAVEESGRSSFQLLRTTTRDGTRLPPLSYFVFDLLYLEGHDLRACPLLQRRRLLEALLAGQEQSSRVRFSESITGHGETVLEHACRLALEGVISKRVDAPYAGTRTSTWLKSKCTNRQEMVIGGFTDPQRSRVGFGALLLGYYDDNQELIYAGRVGTGFDDALLRTLHARLKKLEAKSPAFSRPPRGAEARGAHWVKPAIVCEVEFLEWTNDGRLRHPSFVELREDKDPREVTRECRTSITTAIHSASLAAASSAQSPPARRKSPVSAPIQPSGKASRSGGHKTPTAAARSPARASRTSRVGRSKEPRASSGGNLVAGVTITSPEREVFPDVGVTKLELAEYYAAVGEWMLPHVKGRPLSVVRCPKGQSDACFYQKNWEAGETVGSHTLSVTLSSTRIECLIVDEINGLVWLSQRGVLEVHTWGSTEATLEHPDRMVFDLDPAPDVEWKAIQLAARRLRERLGDRGMTSFVKTTGGKGLHVVVPLKPSADWERVKTFSHELADEMVRAHPTEYIATMSKAKRAGKVFIDYLRNGRGATFIAAFSSRARPGAPVSMPMDWDDLLKRRQLPRFTIRDAVTWWEKNGDPWRAINEGSEFPS